MSTRETVALRQKTLALGVSQISAGSRTTPGGYSQQQKEQDDNSQFELRDHRSLDEVIYDVTSLGYIPSFCTGCYRSGRTGENFMALAKTGLIKNMCAPNALLTFQEYLEDYATPKTYKIGTKLVQQELAKFPAPKRQTVAKMLAKIMTGSRDVYV